MSENCRSSVLSESLRALALKELNETDEVRMQSIAELKDWISTQDSRYSQLGKYYSVFQYFSLVSFSRWKNYSFNFLFTIIN